MEFFCENSSWVFSQKAPSQIFDWVINTSSSNPSSYFQFPGQWIVKPKGDFFNFLFCSSLLFNSKRRSIRNNGGLKFRDYKFIIYERVDIIKTKAISG